MVVNLNKIEGALKFKGSYYMFLQHVGLTVAYLDSSVPNSFFRPGSIRFKHNNVESKFMGGSDSVFISYNFVPENAKVVFGIADDLYFLLHNTETVNKEKYGLTIEEMLANVERFIEGYVVKAERFLTEDASPSLFVPFYLILGEDMFNFVEKYPNVAPATLAYLKYYGLDDEDVLEGFNNLPFELMWGTVS